MNRTLLVLLLSSIFIILSCNETKVPEVKTQEPQVISSNQEKSKVIETPQTDIVFPAFLDLNFVTGKFDPKTRVDFTAIDIAYADKKGRYMHIGAYDSFKKMHAAAKKEGIDLKIKSAARNFDYQKGIWERKWNGTTLLEGKENAAKAFPNFTERAIAILKYSSMPGSSRHHWGTDIDINSFNNSYFETGNGKKEFEWLEANAPKYGYCRPYTKLGTDRSSGYQEERWHWSYRPVADLCTKFAEIHLKNEMITGFLGSEVASKIHIKENYILGISSSCKN